MSREVATSSLNKLEYTIRRLIKDFANYILLENTIIESTAPKIQYSYFS
jgi:hypothetical protein